MQLIQLILQNFFSFVFIISIIVFIHEFGHFYVARLNGVKVETFSLGFGPKIFGFTDKKGTLWKICALPFGGYVKMFGDRNAASVPDHELLKNLTLEERKFSLLGKNVYQRMAIVAAGPIANFILTIFLFTILFRISGLNTVMPVVSEVLTESAAMEAGIKKGDKILAIDDKEINDFDEVRSAIATGNGREMLIKILRADQTLEIKLTPKIQLRKDAFGFDVKIPTLGVGASELSHQDLNILQSFGHSITETYKISIEIFKGIKDLIIGKRDIKELSGPIKIAQYSGKSVNIGITATLWFMAMISLNLGIMNLLPIPMLDGGHLFYYLIELLRGKALSLKLQQLGFGLGIGILILLTSVAVFNDIKSLF